MGSKPTFRLVLGALCMGLFSLGQAHASTLTTSYSGTLSGDDQVQLYSYQLAQASTVVFSTSSYATGGFVPVLSVFNASGGEVGSDGGDATCYAGMTASAGTGLCNDAYLKEKLNAGFYTLAVTEFFNVPVGPNISDGFLMQGQGNYTGATCGATGAFYETDVAPCVQRTSAFSVDITDTPEPATLWLGAVSLVAFGIARRRGAKA